MDSNIQNLENELFTDANSAAVEAALDAETISPNAAYEMLDNPEAYQTKVKELISSITTYLENTKPRNRNGMNDYMNSLTNDFNAPISIETLRHQVEDQLNVAKLGETSKALSQTLKTLNNIEAAYII